MLNMPSERLKELCRLQKQREETRLEAIRQAVTNSEAPLSPDISAVLIRLNDKCFRDILRSHRGFALAERRDSYETSLAIMEQCLQDLLTVICAFENAATTENTSLFKQSQNSELNRFERQVQKELFATANAAASLVDHSRRVIKCNPFPNYEKMRLECFGIDGIHDFVIALRVLLHHLQVIDAGWNVSSNFSEGTQTATFKINKDALLSAIANSPERFNRKKAKDAALFAFIDASPDSVDLQALFCDYRARVAKFHGWLKKELLSEGLVALRDYDNLIRSKVNSDQLLFWKAMLGNWLKWGSPPDPHKHLPRFLSTSQLDLVNTLPRNSKEQVDLVIQFMDSGNAIDDTLRKQIYELFRRSQP